MKRVDELQNMIISCAKRAESLTGAKVQIQSEPIYAERYPCLPICEDFKEKYGPRKALACVCLIRNCSLVLLTLEMCPLRSRRSMIICLLQMKRSRPIPASMPKLLQNQGADEICIKGAKGLAMTGLDLLLNESLRQAAAEYHEKVVPDFYKEK